MSWTENLQRRRGFWRDAEWYDLQLDRRLPLAAECLDEVMSQRPLGLWILESLDR